ncbi:PH domain-containing protein [Candidatus Saccharibacteria bacterium]|nr:PH domain-containing protein [Candidatus Saccharibacteria bacterium]
MEKNDNQSVDYNQPVAYDKDGRPLYAHPPINNGRAQTVHMARSSSPDKIEVSPEVKLKHDRSAKAYPELNLSEGEYVIADVARHPIGLIPPLAIGTFVLSLAVIFLFNYQSIFKTIQFPVDKIDPLWINLPAIVFIGLAILGMYISYFVYMSNRFYLTNESVIQEIQNSLMSKSQQTLSLINVEDASYSQKGLIQGMFDFGTIRLSTEGDETTYRMTYVTNPRQTIATLNNAVEDFKNGRPIDS